MREDENQHRQEETANDRGMAVYLKDGPSLIHNGALVDTTGRWTGANDATTKLLQCLEAVRDLNEQVALLSSLPQEGRSKRHVKSLTVPLFTLYQRTTSLLKFLDHSKHCGSPLSSGNRKKIAECLNAIDACGLTEGDLKMVRDKSAAHVDELAVVRPDLIWQKVDLEKFFQWSILLLAAVSNALVMDVYGWCEVGTPDEWGHLMSVDGSVMHLHRVGGEWEWSGVITFAQSPKISLSDELLAARAAWMRLMGWKEGALMPAAQQDDAAD